MYKLVANEGRGMVITQGTFERVIAVARNMMLPDACDEPGEYDGRVAMVRGCKLVHESPEDCLAHLV